MPSPLTCQPLLIFTDLGEMKERRWEGSRQGGRGVWRLPIRDSSWSPVWSLPLCLWRSKHSHSQDSRGSTPQTQPRAVFDTQSDSGLPIWLDLQGHRQVSLWLGEGSEAQALAVRARMTKVDQQTEGLEGVPGHLRQAASLIASVSHFSISSPQMTASCSGLSVCATSTSAPSMWYRTGLGVPRQHPPEEGVGSRDGSSSSLGVLKGICLPQCCFPTTTNLMYKVYRQPRGGGLVERNRFILMYKAVSPRDHIQQLHRVLEKTHLSKGNSE